MRPGTKVRDVERQAYFARLEQAIDREERAASEAERTSGTYQGPLSIEERLVLASIAAGTRPDMRFMDVERSLYARGLIVPTAAILTEAGVQAL